jgi:hypothetical protein
VVIALPGPTLNYFGQPTGHGGCRFTAARNRKGDKLRACNEYEEDSQMSDSIVFKTEDSLWQMLAHGTKAWDARYHDISDDRIYELSLGAWEKDMPPGRQPAWWPSVSTISFLNKATGEVLKFRYRGMEFVPWAPGWCFLQLGGLVERRQS